MAGDARIDLVDFFGGMLSGASGVIVGQPFDVAIVRVQTAGVLYCNAKRVTVIRVVITAVLSTYTSSSNY
jgi:hypothetical protein